MSEIFVMTLEGDKEWKMSRKGRCESKNWGLGLALSSEIVASGVRLGGGRNRELNLSATEEMMR